MKWRLLSCLALAGLLSLTMVVGSSFAAEVVQTPAEVVLTIADCVKCHDDEPASIAAKGMKHKSEIGCQDCHEDHRPKVENNIPECSMCHEGEEHFELPDCLGCHNPHAPLDITLKGELKAPCLTCHTEQNEQLEQFPSHHTTLACNTCHAERHGVVPECVSCHDPHSEEMTQADCGTCHQAHQPLNVTYGAETANVKCGSCHDTAYSLLAASKAKHKDVACVTCHADTHKTVPQCTDCHGTPHAEGIHAKFPTCAACHNIAHDLNK